MTTAFWVLTAMIAWGSFLAVCVAVYVVQRLLTGRPIL